MRMTQKRFNRVGGYVYDGDKCISHFEDVSHRDDIVTLLNELHEENEDRFNEQMYLQKQFSLCLCNLLYYALKYTNEQELNWHKHCLF